MFISGPLDEVVKLRGEMDMSKKPVVLMILDGYGLNDNCEANAV